jgi:hypothetical protein
MVETKAGRCWSSDAAARPGEIGKSLRAAWRVKREGENIEALALGTGTAVSVDS